MLATNRNMRTRRIHVDRYNDWLAVMNRRLRLAPPKQTLAQVSGRRIMPMRSPFGAITWTPGRAPAQMLPSTSQRMPSAAEGAPLPGMSSWTKRFPLRSVLPSTSQTLISRPVPVSAT